LSPVQGTGSQVRPIGPGIRRALDRLRRRERLLGSAWALARGVSVCAGLFLAACLADYLIDLRRDTPGWLRVGMLAAQAVVWLAALVVLARALLRGMSDVRAALWLEDRLPALGHRLISAVEFHRPGARTQGMSADLIAAVTRQAEAAAEKIDVRQASDGARYRWSLLLLGPVAGVLALLYALHPATALALARRQFLGEQEIPRGVYLRHQTAAVWPAGEEGVVRVLAEGNAGEGHVGEVRVTPEEGGATAHELVYEGRDPKTDDAVFVAHIPPGDVPFTFYAYLRDGRMRSPGRVRYEPRPVVQGLEAWVELPASVGLRAGGRPFEEKQKGGDVLYRLDGSRARVRVGVTKPVARATLTVLGEEQRDVRMRLHEGGAEGRFVLRPGDRGYSVRVIDEYGFANSDPPRRLVAKGSVEPPEVVLLPETFYRKGDPGDPEDQEVEGIPALLGERFRIDYRCAARYGLSHAQVRYRVVPRSADAPDDGALDRDRFDPLPLGGRGKGTAGAKAREEFSTSPAADAESIPGTEGGGRYDFNTAGIPDGKGGLVELKEGDRIQFYVEVFGRAGGPPGRSAVREKEVVGLKAFQAWLLKKEDLKERTRALEEQQRNTRPGGGRE
jgi:hypothetical protein